MLSLDAGVFFWQRLDEPTLRLLRPLSKRLSCRALPTCEEYETEKEVRAERAYRERYGEEE